MLPPDYAAKADPDSPMNTIRVNDNVFRTLNQSLVSGDSNAGNWGRRDNGDQVLFDGRGLEKGVPLSTRPLL